MAFVSFRNLIRHSTTRTTKLGTCSPRKRNFGELHSCHPKAIPLPFSIMSIPTRDTSTSPRCPCPIKTFGATTEKLLFKFSCCPASRDKSRVHSSSERRKNFEKIRSEEHTSEIQSLMRISYAVFGWNKKKQQ